MPVRFGTQQEAEHQCPLNGDDTCYCISTGDCFAIEQLVHIDNCVFDRYAHDNLEIRYNVTNMAGLSRAGKISVSLHAFYVRFGFLG